MIIRQTLVGLLGGVVTHRALWFVIALPIQSLPEDIRPAVPVFLIGELVICLIAAFISARLITGTKRYFGFFLGVTILALVLSGVSFPPPARFVLSSPESRNTGLWLVAWATSIVLGAHLGAWLRSRYSDKRGIPEKVESGQQANGTARKRIAVTFMVLGGAIPCLLFVVAFLGRAHILQAYNNFRNQQKPVTVYKKMALGDEKESFHSIDGLPPGANVSLQLSTRGRNVPAITETVADEIAPRATMGHIPDEHRAIQVPIAALELSYSIKTSDGSPIAQSVVVIPPDDKRRGQGVRRVMTEISSSRIVLRYELLNKLPVPADGKLEVVTTLSPLNESDRDKLNAILEIRALNVGMNWLSIAEKTVLIIPMFSGCMFIVGLYLYMGKR